MVQILHNITQYSPILHNIVEYSQIFRNFIGYNFFIKPYITECISKLMKDWTYQIIWLEYFIFYFSRFEYCIRCFLNVKFY